MAKQLDVPGADGEGISGIPTADERASRPTPISASAPPPSSDSAPPERSGGAVVFADLAERYRETFAERGEGTRRELDDAVRFLTEPFGGETEPLLPPGLSLAELSPERLAILRERLRGAPLRLSRKNLILTYLRMMLHTAFKRREIAVDVAPGAELRAIAATEVADPWGASAR